MKVVKNIWGSRITKNTRIQRMEKILGVIEKAIISCDNSNFNVFDHFVQSDKIVEIGSDAKKINILTDNLIKINKLFIKIW